MQSFLILGSILLCLHYSVKVNAITLSGRINTVCAYLSSQVYCYGGNLTPNSRPNIETTLYAFNLNKTQQLDQLDWELIKAKNDFLPEGRLQPQFAVISNGNQLLVEGGRQDIQYTVDVVNDTIIYDAIDNTWQSASNNSRLISTDVRDHGVTINLPSPTGDNILFFRKTLNGDLKNYSINPYIITYSVASKTYGNFITKTTTPKYAFKVDTSATLDSKTNIIYFFGGRDIGSFQPDAYSDFTTGTTFDTKNGIWSQNNYTSSDGKFPSPRIQLITVLSPNSRHVILYGGQNDNEVVFDYLYTLNLDNNTWTHVNLNATGQALTRASHSAVLVNTTLFILFGYQTNGILAPGSIALNVSDVTNIQLLNQYSPNISNTTTEQQPDASATTTSGSILQPKILSAGAKAGIAVGVIIGAAAIFGVVFLLYRKRAKRLNQSAYQAQKEVDTRDPDALDWDKIENEYLELKRPPALNQLKTNSSLVRLTPDTDPDSTYTIHKAEDISQTPDALL